MSPAQTLASDDDVPVLPTRPGPVRRLWSRRGIRILVAAVLVAVLGLIAVTLLTGTVNDQQESHPRSNTRTGSAALAQLLRDEGVRLEVTTSIEDAVAKSDASTTLVVARPERLTEQTGARLLQARRARLVLIRPDQESLDALQLEAKTAGVASDTLSANCGNAVATRAASILLHSHEVVYRAGASADGCFRSGSGFAFLRVPATGGTADLIAGGVDNGTLDQEGNAAFAMGLLGSQPKIIWLMTPTAGQPTAGQSEGPPLLPDWWLMAVAQAMIAVAALAIWQGRRLGPILSERLPVTVRASETVEGHGRLYERLEARDQAAAALRRRATSRLSAVLGHGEDADALALVVSNRTGRDLAGVRYLLAGPMPADDDHLIDLALNLDQLEQEARQP